MRPLKAGSCRGCGGGPFDGACDSSPIAALSPILKALSFCLPPPAEQIGYYHTFVDGVDFVFVDHPSFNCRGSDIYGGGRHDLMFRCALLSKAALEAVWQVPCGGVPYGDDNCVFVANDWHTALLPVYLQVWRKGCRCGGRGAGVAEGVQVWRKGCRCGGRGVGVEEGVQVWGGVQDCR